MIIDYKWTQEHYYPKSINACKCCQILTTKLQNSIWRVVFGQNPGAIHSVWFANSPLSYSLPTGQFIDKIFIRKNRINHNFIQTISKTTNTYPRIFHYLMFSSQYFEVGVSFPRTLQCLWTLYLDFERSRCKTVQKKTRIYYSSRPTFDLFAPFSKPESLDYTYNLCFKKLGVQLLYFLITKYW